MQQIEKNLINSFRLAKTDIIKLQNEVIKLRTLQQKLTDILLFDVYEGKPLEENQKSFSVAFFLYDSKKTMEDSEIDNLMQKLILSLEKNIDAIIRK